MADRRYFESLGSDFGSNPISENPCSLLGFELLRLAAGEQWSGSSGGDELVAVILGGRCSVAAGDSVFEQIGQRPNVFAGKPYALYIPPGTPISVQGPPSGIVELALCRARARPGAPAPAPFLIRPQEVESGTWGAANFSRSFNAVLVETQQPVQRLIVGETFTPSGNWSTYPPHKHDQELPGKEVWMEEFYYFRISSPEGFGLLKHYTDDGEIDTVYTVRDNSILKLDRGYHTYVGAPGYTSYYLWFLAGNHRSQQPQVDPNLAWLNKAVPLLNAR